MLCINHIVAKFAYMKKTIIIISAMVVCFTNAMAQKYKVTAVERSRIVVDSRYEVPECEGANGVSGCQSAKKFMEPYKHQVDSIMSPVVGHTSRYMASHGPESELSNLLADILVWGSEQYEENADIGIYNLGGIRAALPKGNVTFGDIVNVAPFENKICFVTITGEQLKTLFNQFAHHHGAAVSHSVKAVFNKNHDLVSLAINGEPVDPARKYRLATIDYLLQGNDGFRELTNGTDIVLPQGDKANARYLIANYFRQQMAEGKVVEREIEGRIVIK